MVMKANNGTEQNREYSYEKFRSASIGGCLFLLSTIVVAILMLLPSMSSWTVTARGNFLFFESVGALFTIQFLLMIGLYVVFVLVNFQQIRSKLFRWALYAVLLGASIGVLLASVSLIWIRLEVASQCHMVISDYGGECGEALEQLVVDQDRGFRNRNSAVWALGQLADPSALPTLRSVYTGNIPDREPLDQVLSQYELAKAIRWCEQGNWTSWMYSF